MVKGLNPHIWEAGKIKIGGKEVEKKTSSTGKEYQPSEKWDHFKIAFNEKDDTDNFIEDVETTELIKKNNPGIKTNPDGYLLEIPVKLMYDDIDQNIPTRYAQYVRQTKLVCYGDGETGHDSLLGEKKCPCDALKNNICKLNGMLKLKINGLGILGGCHIFRTTGFNAVNSAIGFMRDVLEITNGVLAEINFHLVLNSKIMRPPNAPAHLGYVPCLIYKGSIDDLRAEALEIVRKENEYLLSIGERKIKKSNGCNQITFINADDEKTFVNEFYPEKSEEKKQHENLSQQKTRNEVVKGAQTDDKKAESDKKTTTETAASAQLENEKNVSDNAVESGFDVYKDRILQAYSDLIKEDQAAWIKWFSDIPLLFNEKEIFNICKSPDWNNAEKWLEFLIKHNPGMKPGEDIPDIDGIKFFINKLVGRKTWNNALGKRGVKSATQVTDFEDFLREITDIPF